ncbi:hypothetical protein OH492_00555 [Vibrio chagasii]|nr:hypothetical protein [Vibrio chagasii]
MKSATGPGVHVNDHTAKDIVSMLLDECKQVKVEQRYRCDVHSKCEKTDSGFKCTSIPTKLSVIHCGSDRWFVGDA